MIEWLQNFGGYTSTGLTIDEKKELESLRLQVKKYRSMEEAKKEEAKEETKDDKSQSQSDSEEDDIDPEYLSKSNRKVALFNGDNIISNNDLSSG